MTKHGLVSVNLPRYPLCQHEDDSGRAMYYNQINIYGFGPVMETKSARLTILIDPAKKEAFEKLCAAQDLTPSQVVRQLIREYLEQHGVSYKTKSTIGARARRKSA
jgi:hypothetical protein